MPPAADIGTTSTITFNKWERNEMIVSNCMQVLCTVLCTVIRVSRYTRRYAMLDCTHINWYKEQM